nr:C-C motif chemokine ligand 19.L [Xenopus laevis]
MALQMPLVFLLIACAWTLTQVSGANINPMDCCLRTNSKQIPWQNVKRYIVQDESSGCSINAIVLVTRRNIHLCAPPREPWVQTMIARFDRKKIKHHK